jgi:hypothetical protein
MLSQLTRYAKNLWARLSSAASQLFRRLTKPARPNLVTGTLVDLPCSRAELLAENALLRQQLMVLRWRSKTPRLTWRERQLVGTVGKPGVAQKATCRTLLNGARESNSRSDCRVAVKESNLTLT